MNQPHHALRNRGFTLVETLATLTISSLLLTLGIPGMGQLLAIHQQTTALNSLVAYAQLARSQAIKEGRRVVLCASDNGTDCNGTAQWNAGYLLFVDQDGDRVRDAHESPLRYQEGNNSVHISTSSGRKTLTYQGDGMTPGSNLTFTFCDAQDRVPPKALIVSNTGRPRIADRRSDGTPLSCG